MRRWLVPPHRDDDYETFAVRVLHYTLLLLIAVALVFLLFVSSAVQVIFIPILILMLGGSYYLLHRGRDRLASSIFLSGLWLIITLASFSINGIRNASMSAYAIVIIYAALLLSSRTAIVFTVLSILSAVILALGEVGGLLPLRSTPLYLPDRFFQHLALFGAAGILLSMASRVIRASFARVRQSEAQYRLLFENIPVMAAVYAQDGEIILINHAAAETLGGTTESLQGRSVHDVFSAEDAEGAIYDQTQVIAQGKPMLIEGKATLPGGREIIYLRHIMPLPDLDLPGRSQVLVLTTDLTEKHLAQQRERELSLARERNDFLSDFFSTLSHDLKTPLSVINTSLHLLGRAEHAEQRELRMTQISSQVALMEQFIQDMLTISRLEHLPAHHFEALDLNPLVDTVVAALRPRMEAKQLACLWRGQPNLPAVQGDQEQLRRMLMNLIENAVNYTPVGGQISIQTALIDERVGLEVSDSGIGIAAEELPQIFDRFYRATNARSSANSGTGLGLAIVKKIVDMHAATIEVHSAAGEGTRFQIQFPAQPPY